MPVAAIEALVLLLSQSHASTVSETLDLLASSTAHLKRCVPNPISLSAGTDLFQRYLITTLQRPAQQSGASGAAGGTDFQSIRRHLLTNGRLFVQRAKESRRTIASYACRFIRDGTVVLTNGGSRVVGAVLTAAAEVSPGSSVRFKVIYVQPQGAISSSSSASSSSSSSSPSPSLAPAEGANIISALRALSVPVAVIPESAVAYSLATVSLVLVGAEGVVENGGIISRMGTYQLGILARSADKPFYVVAESHKFVRLYPLGQYDLPIEQKVLDFRTDSSRQEGGENNDGSSSTVAADESTKAAAVGSKYVGLDEPATTHDINTTTSVTQSQTSDISALDMVRTKAEKADCFDARPSCESHSSIPTDGIRHASAHPDPFSTAQKQPPPTSSSKSSSPLSDAVDYTPPDLITALITESGVHTPSAVSEELIKLWY